VKPSRRGISARSIHATRADYRSLRAGEGFRTNIFGRDVERRAARPRSTSAIDVGRRA
jgi:hypothetical protein